MKLCGPAFGLLLAVCPLYAQPGYIDVRDKLDQGWPAALHAQYAHTDQGSMMMPMDLFLSLKTADGKQLSTDLERFGFIPDPDGTATNEPVRFLGVAIHKDTETQKDWVGLTCAACHTGRIRYLGKWFLVEGAPSMLDFDSFYAAVVDAVNRSPVANNYGDLKASLNTRLAYNATTIHAGFARVDAFGQIYNQVSAVALKNGPAGTAAPDAPVSYPLLWDIVQHERVQWNGSAPNLGEGGDGSKLRNIGEVLGVFGQITVPNLAPRHPKFKSSVAYQNVVKIEEWLKDLYSPSWPDTALPPIDAEMRRRGELVYNRQDVHCSECHKLLKDNNKRNRSYPLPIQMTKLTIIQTDPKVTVNFDRTANTRQLKGKHELLYPRTPFRSFKSTDALKDITAYMALGVLAEDRPSLIASLKDSVAMAWNVDKDFDVYKARPLNGIWATAPYLHNGSVPNLDQLLTAPTKRAQAFCLGSLNDFDPDIVGYATPKDAAPGCAAGEFRFDATLPGNRNGGHDYGTSLSADEKSDLIAFLKSL
jgi:hypothetical protein